MIVLFISYKKKHHVISKKCDIVLLLGFKISNYSNNLIGQIN